MTQLEDGLPRERPGAVRWTIEIRLEAGSGGRKDIDAGQAQHHLADRFLADLYRASRLIDQFADQHNGLLAVAMRQKSEVLVGVVRRT